MSHYDDARDLEEQKRKAEILSRKKSLLNEADSVLRSLERVIVRTKFTLHDYEHIHIKQKFNELKAIIKEYCSD